MKTVGMFVFPGVQALDISGPLDVFAEANSLLPVSDRYEITLIGLNNKNFKASNGMIIAADVSHHEARGGYDLFLIAGGPSLPSCTAEPDMISGIRRLALASTIYGSICTGAFLLGAAGLLDGRKVTTHWQNARQLAEQFPDAIVEFDKIFLKDGSVVTSAGVTAGIDLALSIVRADHGYAISLAVAKRLVVVLQRSGGQSQFSPYIELTADTASPLSQIAAYVMANLHKELSVAELAAACSMSERSFARVFVTEMKNTPARFVENARIDAARALLESSTKPLKIIAYECGFGNVKRMREAFLKRLGVLPTQYREQFTVMP